MHSLPFHCSSSPGRRGSSVPPTPSQARGSNLSLSVGRTLTHSLSVRQQIPFLGSCSLLLMPAGKLYCGQKQRNICRICCCRALPPPLLEWLILGRLGLKFSPWKCRVRMLPLAGSCAALSSGVTGWDVLSQGSSGMKQQNAAWPAAGRSHIPSVRPPPQPRGHPCSEASPPGPLHLPGKGTASISQHPPHSAAFVCSGEFGNAAGLQLSATHGWPGGEC